MDLLVMVNERYPQILRSFLTLFFFLSVCTRRLYSTMLHSFLLFWGRDFGLLAGGKGVGGLCVMGGLEGLHTSAFCLYSSFVGTKIGCLVGWLAAWGQQRRPWFIYHLKPRKGRRGSGRVEGWQVAGGMVEGPSLVGDAKLGRTGGVVDIHFQRFNVVGGMVTERHV